MARLGKILLDGAALALVGVALSAAITGYVGSLPDPAHAVAEQPAAWDDPVATGSIVAAPGFAAIGAASGAERAESVGAVRVWVDPPRRRVRPAGRDDG